MVLSEVHVKCTHLLQEVHLTEPSVPFLHVTGLVHVGHMCLGPGLLSMSPANSRRSREMTAGKAFLGVKKMGYVLL